jgi:hypothetical protein
MLIDLLSRKDSYLVYKCKYIGIIAIFINFNPLKDGRYFEEITKSVETRLKVERF